MPGKRTTAEDRKRLFASHYLANGRNATAAAIAAGYSENGAKVTASRLLNKDPLVRSLVEEKTKRVEKKLEISAERVLQQYAKIAFADVKDFYTFDERGNVKLKPFDEIDGTVLDSIEQIMNAKGDRSVRVKLRDQRDALEKIFKYLGMDKQQLNVNLDVSLGDVLMNAWKQKQGGGSNASD